MVKELPKVIFLGPNKLKLYICSLVYIFDMNIVESIFLGLLDVFLTSSCIVLGHFMFMYSSASKMS